MKSILAALLAIVFLFASSPANAALNVYLTLTGKQTGAINGGVTQAGRQNSIMVIAVEHQASTGFDARTGQNTGAMTQGVFTITKELDKSSPVLRRAMATNDVITSFDLKFYAQPTSAGTGTGIEVQNFTITMKNAHIVNIKFHMLNNKNPELMKYSEYEEVSFTYEQITWTWVSGGITWSDTWSSKS